MGQQSQYIRSSSTTNTFSELVFLVEGRFLATFFLAAGFFLATSSWPLSS